VAVGSVEHLDQVFSHILGPSFVLGAVAGFTSLLFTRLTAILDRVRSLNAISEDQSAVTPLKSDIPRLRRRARLVNNAIFLSVCSGIVATVLIILVFGSFYLGVQHAWGAALLFVISLMFLCSSLVLFAIEVLIALSEYDHHYVELPSTVSRDAQAT